MASQSAPNCKQKKKRKQKNKRKQKSHKHVIFAFFCLISAKFVMILSVFFTTEACCLTPQKCAKQDSLLVQSKPKSTQYKDKWAFEVFRSWQGACEQKFCILDPGSMFKDYDLHHVQSLGEKLEDLHSLSPNFWLTKFVQEVANKNGGRNLPRSFYGIVCGACQVALGGHKWRECIESFRKQ